MFGQFHAMYDLDLAKPRVAGVKVRDRQAEYAEGLLSDLLNRWRPVHGALDALDRLRDEPVLNDREESLQEAVETLRAAVRVFGADVDEARIRGRRALLFFQDEGTGQVLIGSYETAKELADVGGPLVSGAQIEAESVEEAAK